MKGLKFSYKWTIFLVVLTIAAHLTAQDRVGHVKKVQHHHYQLVDLATFGGPNSSTVWGGPITRTLNDKGVVTGEADISVQDPYCIVDCWVNHVFRWQNSVFADLGQLANPDLSIASWINSRGWIAGIVENGGTDPLTGYPETDAVLWTNRGVINLGTLGGNVGGANAINNRGQVVGGATNSILDPFSAVFPATYCGANPCIFEGFPFFFFPLATQVHAFLWESGGMSDLGTLGGPDSIALFINEAGEIAGMSYVNSVPNKSTGVPSVDPFFIGTNNKMVDVGNLGGTATNLTGLNNRGQIVGTMTLAGDTIFHPFSWVRGSLTDLGTLGGSVGEANAVNDAGEVVGWAQSPTAVLAFVWKGGVMTSLGTVNGDACSVSDGINSRGQVVGESSPSCFGEPAEEAFLWENGSMVDLNTLIPANSGLELAHAFSINDRGEINGEGVLANGDHHAFLLIPCDDDHLNIEDCDYSTVDESVVQRNASAVRPVTVTPQTTSSPAQTVNQLRNRRMQRYRLPDQLPTAHD